MSAQYVQIISDFTLNRADLSEYTHCLTTLYEQFSTSDEFAEMPSAQRKEVLNKTRELKELIANIIKAAKKPELAAQVTK
jgi:hypothetical protein